MENNSGRVYSYMRFSTPEQARGDSLTRQKSYAEKYAAANDLILDETLTMRDEGLSAYHSAHIKRGAFGLFLAAVEAGKVPRGSILIVEALDRISRAEPIIAQNILCEIILAGIKVITAIDGNEYDRESVKREPMRLVYSLLLFVRSNEESETKSRRVKDQILKQIEYWQTDDPRKQIITNGRAPYWVRPNANKTGFELDEDRAETVRYFISLYMDGYGVGKIAKKLNDDGVPLFAGKQWYNAYIWTVLKQRCLIGEKVIEVDGIEYTIADYYPKIIDEPLFLRLQNEITTRAPTKGQREIPALLTGMRIFSCGICGRAITAQNYTHRMTAKGSLARGFRRLRCIQKNHGAKPCKNGVSVQAYPIESAVLNYCRDRMELSSLLSDSAEAGSVRTALHATAARLAGIEKQLDSLAQKFIILDDPPAVLVDKMRALETEKAELNKTLKEQAAKVSVLEDSARPDIVEEWQKITDKALGLDEAARLKARQLVKKTFKRIEVFFSEDYPHLQTMNGEPVTNAVRLILHFRNGAARHLIADKETGARLFVFDAETQIAPWVKNTVA